jgi:hypothetical protein
MDNQPVLSNVLTVAANDADRCITSMLASAEPDLVDADVLNELVALGLR